ncbi:MGMT family protein [Streptococcus constellatus]|uniref:MGMT family protein n=1 Tax=Streptococcus constellatus TaxID=76860 RepID=UPI0012395750|nr:MGMT family protein [Streptococcus constellatus]
MRKVLNGKLVHQILSVVSCIPLGSVATYGQIAQLIGRERNARLVGRVLSQAGLYGKYPCHRVVNSAGRLAPAWEEQRHLLWAEGVTFKTNGCVDLKKHQWRPTDISKV